MKYIRVLLPCLLLAALCACQPEQPEAPAAPAMEGPIASMPGAADTTDIGTVETTLLVEGTLGPDMPLANIQQEILGGMRGSTSLASYTVTGETPRPFWVQFKLRARETYTRAVVLRGAVYRDDVALRPVATVIGENVPHELYPSEFMVDALEGLDPVPASTLLILKAQVFLLPEGTDATALNPDTVSVPEGEAGFVMSNPVRLQFAAPGAAQ